MILNTREALVVVRNQNMTESDEPPGPWRTRAPIRIHVFFAEERERSECSIRFARGLTHEHATEPPPTFPFLESQCQRAALRHELLLCQRSNAARKIVRPAGGADRVYRGVLRASQTVNEGLWQFFFNGKKWRNSWHSGRFAAQRLATTTLSVESPQTCRRRLLPVKHPQGQLRFRFRILIS
jgi:hypothetical protein